MAGFQTQATYNPAPAVEGDFASTNPRATVLAGPGGLVAGSSFIVGRAIWLSSTYVDDDGAPAVANAFGSGAIAGIAHREQQGLIQQYLQEFTMQVPAGFPVTVFASGDFWVKNNGSTQALPGMKAYANFADGKFTAAATGSASTASGSASSVAASTFSVTGSIADNVLTVTAVGSGTVVAGGTISGTGIATGTKIVSQLSGTTGGIGTYAVSIPEQTVASTTVSGTYGTLTVGGTVAGVFGVGQSISGSGVVAGTTITALGTGTGGAGSYIVDNNTVVASTAITAATNVETKFVVRSSALPGELMKISSWLQG
ncbi:hypothetical protein FHX10_003400 [Rhizobium sp. BK591]|uniref:structural cement protein Gp24 n=1 Tax=Rhizobium sp. BK591 TaxID=2586985 RepID=UPI0016108F55|nr:hypothetical protein [Rhizobium sp. BK591]MBB3743901.1 hypothetical protein [Rhizobium sp. BK591]